MLRYTIHQALFWFADCGINSFAVTYLEGKGFEIPLIGIMMFCGNCLSFSVQMFLADFADRNADKNSLPILMSILGAISLASLFFIRAASLSTPVFFILYMLLLACFDMEIPLMNSTCVYYAEKGYKISFGIPRGVAAFMYGVASLLFGFLMRDFGIEWMPNVTILIFVLFIITSITYPKVNPEERNLGGADAAVAEAHTDALGILPFIKKYKWYAMSLISIALFGLVHLSSENYLIEIFKNVGGDSSNVGVALFIATTIEAPVTLVAMWAMRKAGAKKIWILVGISFMLKMTILFFARSVTAVYLGQVTQLTTYSLIPPGQVYYSNQCVGEADMVKGQSISTAAYVLGCAIGNLLGGIIVGNFGVKTLLVMNFVLAFVSVAVAAVCVPKALAEREGISDDKLRN